MLDGGVACAVSSGTSALYLALRGLGVSRGDQVSVPTYSCSALLNAVNMLGANAIPIDIKSDDFTICDKSVEKLAPNSKFIIAVHCFGASANISALKKNGRYVVEDCCQSLGGTQGREGDVSIYSFYATKIITGGQGGLIWSLNNSIMKSALDFREFDCCDNYIPRFNFQMTDIQAAMILSQYSRLENIRSKRQEIREKYIFSIDKLLENGWNFQKGLDSKELLPYRFILLAPNETERLKLQNKLLSNGIESIVPIEKYELLHRYLDMSVENYPVSERLSEVALSIPLYPALEDKEIDAICSSLKATI